MADKRFNVQAAVRYFGGPTDLARRMEKHGSIVTVKAIEKWHERGQIPGVWIVRLSQLARREGRIFDINDFIIHDKGKAK